MDIDKVQLLRNPEIVPTNDVIAQALNDANEVYIRFIDELARHDIQLVWRYYTDGKAWLAKGLYKWTGVRGGQKEMTVFWLSIWNGFFKVTTYLPVKERAKIQRLPLNESMMNRIANAKQMGKLNYFPLVFDVSSDEQFDSIFCIANFKKNSI